MNKWLFVLNLCVCAVAFAADVDVQSESASSAVGAASHAAVFPSEEARAQERQRLDQKKQQIDDQYKQDMKQCYQQFDVVSCKIKARDHRIEAKAALRKEELPFKVMERQIKTEEAKQRLAERQSEAKLKRMRRIAPRPLQQPKIVQMQTPKNKLITRSKAPSGVIMSKSSVMLRSIAKMSLRNCASATKNPQRRCQFQADESPPA